MEDQSVIKEKLKIKWDKDHLVSHLGEEKKKRKKKKMKRKGMDFSMEVWVFMD